MEELPEHMSDSRQNEPWLAVYLHETLLPGSPWHKVLDRVGAIFVEKVEPFLKDPKERQMVFKLLGKDFVEKHFSKYPNNPSLLHPPHISTVEYEKLEKNKQVWLSDLWTKTAEQVDCYFSGDPGKLSAEMTHFVDHTFNLVGNKMNLILALPTYSSFQNDVAKIMRDYSGMDNELLAWRSFSRRRPKSVESKDIAFAIDRAERFKLNKNKGMAEVEQKTPPPLSCAESEALGNTLCAVIKSNSSTMTTVCKRLNGHLLPKGLRQFIWLDKLLRSEKKLKGEKIEIIEKEAREKYGKMLEHKRAELKLRSATRSPISGLIENAVVEKYGGTPSMYQFATHEQMVDEASKSLNVLYVYNGTYEPYLIHRLFPLQVAFRQTPPTAEHPYELFMYLHLLIKNIFPSWLEIFAMAERVMDTLQSEDMELFTHLQRSFQRGVTFNSEEFLADLIAQEREEAMKRYAIGHKMDNIDDHRELLANPVIILRKWMGEGFVNFLDLPAVLLIWDQLFMHDWNRKVMESFCLALLMLLRDSILTADNYPAIRQVLLNDGYHLFTADIQRAWLHLQQGGQLVDIPRMNRLIYRQVRELSPRLQDMKDAKEFGKILSFGIKDIVLKVSPSPTGDKSSKTLLKDFDPTAVSLVISVYYGVTKLSSKTSSLKPFLLENVKYTRKEVPTFALQFNDKFEFELTDLPDYIIHTESREKPFILMEVLYLNKKRAPQTLGWEKVDAFEREAMSTQEIWKPREISSLLSLHLGEKPENVNEGTPGINRSGSHESTIGLTVYDPTRISQHEIFIGEEYSRKNEDLDLGPVPHWVPHNKSTLLPHSTTLQEAFDLYIDALNYIPDCATIIKVSCQILNSGTKAEPSIVAFPRMDSPARNPMFNIHQELNTENDQLHVTSCILFQVSTVDSGNVAIIGNCMLRVFDDDGKLNVGGFQLRLRTGLPSKKLTSLKPEDLQKYPVFPCCSLLVRLLPHTESSEPVPSYVSGYYFTDEAKPTRSEMEIMSTFQKDTLFPMQVKDMAEQLMEKEQSQESNAVFWYKFRIGGDKSSFIQPALSYCSIHHAVQYRQHSGLRLKITQAFGLEVEGLYINAFARILKGAQSLQLPELPQNWGGDEKFLTRQHDFTSLQTSPRWTDPSVVLHPYLDENSVLLVQLFSMAATYVPHANSENHGRVISKNGQELELQPPLGWTVFPLFDRDYVNSGIHSAPLFQGFPNIGFLQSISMTSLKTAIQEALAKKHIQLQKNYGSITMELWDGHYFDEERYALPVVNDQLPVKNIKKFLATQNNKKGKDMSMLVKESLDKKQQKLHRDNAEYQRHQQFYEEAMGEKFYNLIETALLNAGYGPL